MCKCESGFKFESGLKAFWLAFDSDNGNDCEILSYTNSTRWGCLDMLVGTLCYGHRMVRRRRHSRIQFWSLKDFIELLEWSITPG